jgi:hypothetical protein
MWKVFVTFLALAAAEHWGQKVTCREPKSESNAQNPMAQAQPPFADCQKLPCRVSNGECSKVARHTHLSVSPSTVASNPEMREILLEFEHHADGGGLTAAMHDDQLSIELCGKDGKVCTQWGGPSGHQKIEIQIKEDNKADAKKLELPYAFTKKEEIKVETKKEEIEVETARLCLKPWNKPGLPGGCWKLTFTKRACSANGGCAKLKGNCCPTDKVEMLSCCSAPVLLHTSNTTALSMNTIV